MHLKLKYDAHTIRTVPLEKILISRGELRGKVTIMTNPQIIKKIDLETAIKIENILVDDLEYNGEVIDLVIKHKNKKQPKALISEYCPICSAVITKENIMPAEYVCPNCESPISPSAKNEKCEDCGSEEKKIKLETEVMCFNNHVSFITELLKEPFVIREPSTYKQDGYPIEKSEVMLGREKPVVDPEAFTEKNGYERELWLCPCGYIGKNETCAKCGGSKNHPDVKPFPLDKTKKDM